MKKCGNCGLTYPDEMIYCNNCGAVLETEKPPKKNKGSIIAIVILSILTFSFFVGIVAIAAEYDSENRNLQSSASRLQQQVSSLNAVTSAQKNTIQNLEEEYDLLLSDYTADALVNATYNDLMPYFRAPSENLQSKQNVFLIDANETVQVDIFCDLSDVTIRFHNFDEADLDISWIKEWDNHWTKLNVTGLQKGYNFVPVYVKDGEDGIGEQSLILLFVVK